MDPMQSSKPPRQQSLVTMFPYRQDATGCPLCVICGAELRRMDGLPRRKDSRYCSDVCCDEAWVRAGITARIRELLAERDKGICADCGLDCAKIEDALDKLVEWSPGIFRTVPDEINVAWRELARQLKSAFRLRAARLGFRPYCPTWEAHHVVPVSEGGGGCGLEGYATLCLRCHKRASAELAARRARLSGDGEPAGQMGLPFA